MDLKILHNKHSNYFFLLTIFLCLMQFFIKIDTDQAWVYITCFFLIITVGVSHGGLDNLKGKRLFNKLKLKSSFLLFYLAYISFAILILILWFNFGHQHLGLSMAPGSAKLITSMIDGDVPPIDASPYRADRFPV